MSATAPCKGTAEKESPPCFQCRYDTKNPGVETEASCGRHTETWRRHKRLFAGTATADDMTFTRNLIAVGFTPEKLTPAANEKESGADDRDAVANEAADPALASGLPALAAANADDVAPALAPGLAALDPVLLRPGALEMGEVLALINPGFFGEAHKAHAIAAAAHLAPAAAARREELRKRPKIGGADDAHRPPVRQ